MNPALVERLEEAKWNGRETVDVKVSELQAMIEYTESLRQQKIQLEREAAYNDDEKLLGFVKLEAIQGIRQGKVPSLRVLKYKSPPYFIVPVYLKLSAIKRL